LGPYRAGLSLALFAGLASAGASALYAYLIGPLLKAVLTEASVRIGRFSFEGADLAWKLPAFIAVVALVKAATQFVHTGLMQATGQRVIADLRRKLYARLLELPPSFFDQRHSGELLSRLTADLAQAEFSVSQALGSYTKDGLQILALLAVCLLIDPRLFVLGFVVLPASVWPISRFAKSLKRSAANTQASLGELTQLAAEQLHNLPIVQAYRAEPRALQQFDALQARHLREMQRSFFIRGAFSPTLEFLGTLGVAVLVGVGANLVRLEPTLAGKLVSFVAAVLLLYQPLKSLSGTFSLVVQGMAGAQRLFEIIDERPAPDEGQEAFELRREIRFEEVVLSYDGERAALRGLSLVVPAGRRVALVGESGSGKTTIFSVLLRFVERESGSITWDGEELAKLRPSSLRAQIAWVPQEPVLFSGTVRQNLQLARPDATEPELWEALRRAHAADFVRAFPEGLHEPLGERGSRLSGGQRQRLAIARAFLRRPSVLLLDEPTSALDAASEHEVQAGLSELMRDRTVVIVAHRLSTVRDADVIYVLDQGRTVEQGTHAELVSRQGAYARLLRQSETEASPREALAL
jgi:subfamily B ATP-binding cassette protein MsbA